MKKVFLTVAIVAAAVLGMTSCSNKEKCWEIKMTVTVEGSSVSETAYYWGTKDKRDADIDDAKAAVEKVGGTLKIDKKKHVKASDRSDCEAKNLD